MTQRRGSRSAPSQRGRACVWVVAGCFGSAILLLALLAFFLKAGYQRVMSTAGPPVTAANLRATLPPGVPLHPGLTIDDGQSRFLQGSARLTVDFLGSRPVEDQKWLAFRSKETPGAVADWYGKRLKPAGWTAIRPNEIPGATVFTKGARVFVVYSPGQVGRIRGVTDRVYLVSGQRAAAEKQKP